MKLYYDDDIIWLNDVKHKINTMNDNSKFEFDNDINLLPDPPPSTPSLIAAKWTTTTPNKEPAEKPTVQKLFSKPTVKLKTPLTDVNNNQWYRLPNGKWKPLPVIKTTSSCHNLNLQYINNKWQEQSSPSTKPIATNTIPSSAPSTIQSNDELGAIIQTDSGANICATGMRDMLHDYQTIEPRTVDGVNKDDPNGAELQGYGFMFITNTDGKHLKIKVYYSPNIENTIISPQSIAMEYQNDLYGWYQYSNVDKSTGTLGFCLRNGDKIEFDLKCHNNLWYHQYHKNLKLENMGSVAKVMSDTQNYTLWHSRLGHPGSATMQSIHLHANGVPKLKGNTFFRCPSCMPMKIAIKKPLHESSHRKPVKPKEIVTVYENDSHVLPDDLHMPKAMPGQHFHMDFGFVRGSKYKSTNEEGRIITSIDGYNSYLLIVDRHTRYAWIFLTSSKHPPVKEAEAILKKFGSPHPHKTVCTDQGKELGLSNDFKAMLAKNEFSLKVTGSDNSRENGRAERPHRTLAQIMRCILHSADMGPQYWSFALVHAVKLYNCIPHTSIKTTPTEAFTGTKPNLANLRIFGSRVFAKKPGNRPFKLDNHAYEGIYLGHTSNNRNVYIRDQQSGRIKIGAHVYFDEAHMTAPAGKVPLAAQALQRIGYNQSETWVKEHQQVQEESNTVSVEKLSKTATLPTRGTPGSIGYDVANPGPDITINPGETKVIQLDIAITPPPGCYTRVAPRSGLTVKNHITVMAGVIDPDYTGNIGVVLHNFGNKPQTLKNKQKIAQLIFENINCPRVVSVDKLKSTRRSNQGFGSTDDNHANIKRIESAKFITTNDLNLTLDLPYTINLSKNPFEYTTTRIIPTNDSHPTLGLELTHCNQYNRLVLNHCKPSTPAAKLHHWRSQLQHSYLLQVDGIDINTHNQLKSHIRNARKNQQKSITVTFATSDSHAIHPQHGVPQMYHDQLDVIGKHLWDLCHHKKLKKWTPVELQHVTITDNIKKILPRHVIRKLKTIIKTSKPIKKPKKLTRRYLQQQQDWLDWFKSEHKQLEQYEQQNTFGPPQPYPKGANLLNLLWTYLIKDDGRKKARCVCNGFARMHGTVTLGETYAASLDQTGSRIFWAVTALTNMIVIGADVSNAFADAPPPIAPLYVTIDKPFREWWASKGRPKIPDDYVMRVQGALQGHPESPRLWSILIDKIIQNLNLKPCHHEPCLYYTSDYNHTGKTVLFLRQVDDFAVACQDQATAKQVIADINSKMTINVKELGIIERFNGVDILQTRDYVKLYNETYIEKIISSHPWLQQNHHTTTFPIPMQADAEYRHKLENATPATPQERQKLEQEFKFKYRQGVGELLYAMVTCRPDIAFPVVKLSQYSVAPSRIHFEAIKQLYIYIKQTKQDGIYYWRKTPRSDLKQYPPPDTKPDSNYSHDIPEKTQHTPPTLVTAVDSDHASDSTHRKSVSGIIHMLAGGVIHYKCKYQDIIATSSSEAEFIAAAEAGKQILYIRSILQAIGIEQKEATTLYEDNMGALLMASAHKPTKRTKHMDIRHFALQDWVDRDLILLKRIATIDNYADAMTKPLARTLFHRHMNYIQGKVIPPYAPIYKKHQTPIPPTIHTLNFKSYSIHIVDVLSPRFRTGEGVV